MDNLNITTKKVEHKTSPLKVKVTPHKYMVASLINDNGERYCANIKLKETDKE